MASRSTSAGSVSTLEFWARPVISPSAPWVRYDEQFTDAGVASDFLGSLGFPSEPCVVRAAANGRQIPAPLKGLWLCDAATPKSPVRIPAPRWRYSVEATAWSSARTWLDAWETCDRMDWMCGALTRVDPKYTAEAAVACLDRAAQIFVPDSERTLRYVENLRRSIHDRELRDENLAAELRALYGQLVVTPVTHPSAAPNANRALAIAISYTTRVVRYHLGEPYQASRFASWAMQHLGNIFTPSETTTAYLRQECADLVRRHVPTLVVLRAAVRRRAES